MKIPYQISVPFCVSLILYGCAGAAPEDPKTNRDTNNTTPPVLSLKESLLKEGLTTGSLQVQSSRAYTNPITIDLAVEWGTADQNDLAEVPLSVTLPPNSSTISAALAVIDDNIYEGQETFVLEIKQVSEGTISPSQNKITVKLDDNDPMPSVRFDRLSSLVSEQIGTFSPTVSIDRPSSKELAIGIEYSGTATPEDDYTVQTASAIIPAGALQASFPINILSDVLPEGGETIISRIVSGGTYLIAEQSIHTTIISGDVSLNDTGIATYFDGEYFNQLESNESYPGQDAAFGPDESDLESIDGHRSLSLTKLDGAGNELPFLSNTWSCVRDNQTGLVWEVKQPVYDLQPLEDDLKNKETTDKAYKYFTQFRAANFRYTWFTSDTTNDGRSSGAPNDQLESPRNYDLAGYCGFQYEKIPPSWPRRCNTDAYIKEMNWYGICGSKKWRLPTAEEMRSLTVYDYNYVKEHDVYFPIEFFPNAPLNALYYTSTPSAEFDASVWCIDVANGEMKLCNKQTLHSIRLVTDSL